MNLSRLTREQYGDVRRLIDEEDLHPPRGQMPVDIFGLAYRLGWEVVVSHNYRGVWGSAAIVGEVKVVSVSADVSGGVQRGCVAHVIGHELLGHRQALDVMVPSALEEIYPRICEFQDDCDAWGAASILMIPDRYTHLSPEEIAANCHVSYQTAMRRLSGIVIDGLMTTAFGPRLIWSNDTPLEGVGT